LISILSVCWLRGEAYRIGVQRKWKWQRGHWGEFLKLKVLQLQNNCKGDEMDNIVTTLTVNYENGKKVSKSKVRRV